MSYIYDTGNIFAKILRGEIPNNTVMETDHCIAFHDINPQRPLHVLVIPKGAYVCFDHFAADASPDEIVDFTRTIGAVCKMLNVTPGENGAGYRIISNAGIDGLQDVPHLHVHILAGISAGPMMHPAVS